MMQIDFMRRPAQPMAGWILLVLGGMAVSAAYLKTQDWRSQRQALEAADRARIEAAEADRRRASIPRVLTVDERRLVKITPQLRQPWLPTLRLIESTTNAPIYLTSLSLDPSVAEVRIEGEAPDFASALAYIQSLSEPGLLEVPQILTHEAVRDRVVKFTARATWILR